MQLPELQTHFLVLILLLMVLATIASSTVLSRHVSGMVQSDGKPHMAWLDGLRGLAATLVLLNHAPLIWRNLELNPQVFVLGDDNYRLLAHLGVIGVQIFFCITGFLFTGKLLKAQKVDWTGFFLHRIRRLVPAYVAAVLLVLVLVGTWEVPRHFASQAIAALPDMLSFGLYPLPWVDDFNTARLLSVNWTLAFEWRFYVLLPLFYALARLFRTPLLGIGIIALGFATLVGFGVWIFFVVGALTATIQGWKPSQRVRRLAYVVLVLVVISMTLQWDFAARSRPLQGLHVATLFVACVLTRPAVLSSPSLVALGTVSYSLYLLHLSVLFIVVGLTHNFVHDTTLLPVWAFALMLVVSAVAAVGMAGFSYRWIELPFLRRTNQKIGAEHQPTKQSDRSADRPYF